MTSDNRKTREQTKVVVAMSGGVDSSVAAALLVQKGYQVIGMMMRLWSRPGSECENRCCTPDAMAQARRVAAILGIPFYAVDARKIFHETVVRYFVNGYSSGLTPNPCLVCNRSVRWGFLLDQAQGLGSHAIATGHYARLLHTTSGNIQLLRALDRNKDQSYVLHMLTQKQLSQTLLPLGEYNKPAVRQIASDLGLPVAERPDSQDLCFIGNSTYVEFLTSFDPNLHQVGPIFTLDGQQIGTHHGLAFYTIGQRKRLGIQSAEPLYVVDKDQQNNSLIVGKINDVWKRKLQATEVNWISGNPPSDLFRAHIQIRYKAQEVWGLIKVLNNSEIEVTMEEPVRDITPGQAVVIYDEQVCLGGGIITSSQ